VIEEQRYRARMDANGRKAMVSSLVLLLSLSLRIW
jgi:hypothetical protein